MQPVVVNEGRAPWLRWLAIPMAMLVIIVVALSISGESRDEFIERAKLDDRNNSEQAQRTTDFDDAEFSRIRFLSEDGEAIEFAMDGQHSLGRDAEGTMFDLELVASTDGVYQGVAINPDGTMELFKPGEDTSDRPTIVPTADGGLVLNRPGEDPVVLRAGQNGITATDSSGQGDVELPRDSQGRVDLGDGLSAEQQELGNGPGAQAGTSDPQEAGSVGEIGSGDGWGGPGLGNLAIVLAGLMGLAGAVWWFVAMKPKFAVRDVPIATDQQPFEPAPMPSFSESASPWEAFEDFLTQLRSNPDADQTIRLAYGYAEQGVGSLRARSSDETPGEWTADIAHTQPDLAELHRSLTNRYSAVRFGNQPSAEADKLAAIEELRELVYGACT